MKRELFEREVGKQDGVGLPETSYDQCRSAYLVGSFVNTDSFPFTSP